MPEYKLTYFGVRVLGEPIRWMLLTAGATFTDDRVGFEQWGELKPVTGWGQLPVLSFDGQELTQSAAISEYLARKYNFLPATDVDAAKCHQYVGHIQDCRGQWAAYYREPDAEKREEIKQDLLKNLFPYYLGKLNKAVEANGGTYIVGGSLTWADFWLANFLDIWEDSISPNLLDNYPALKKNKETVMAIPQIKQWVAKRPIGTLNTVPI